MSERSKVTLRMIFVTLIVANALFFAYAVLTPDTRAGAGSRIEELEINPGRIKLLGSATRGPGGQAAGAKGGKGAYRACLEWGPFAASDIAKAENALTKLELAQPALQRPVNEASGGKRFAYFVREPDAAIVAQIAELQRAFPGTEIKAGPCP
jgi:hypothetical protein